MIYTLMDSVVDRLKSQPYFDDIAVLSENVKDIQGEIDVAIAKIGLCCVVLTARAERVKPGVRPPYFEGVHFVVATYEVTAVNRGEGGTGKKALDVAEMVVASLHGFRPDGIVESITSTTPAIQLVPHGELLIYDAPFITCGGLGYDVPKVDQPSAVQEGGLVTLACGTPGAVLVYSVDGSTYPSPRNANADSPSAYFYSGPFAAVPGGKVKVRAWLPGYTDSLVTELNMT